MLQKFKTTTYATLLLIGVFVLPYAGHVADVNAEDYNCRGTKKEVKQCLKAVITERDEMIDKMDAARAKMEKENRRSANAQKVTIEKWTQAIEDSKARDYKVIEMCNIYSPQGC
jgi:hypothetical protein